MTHINSWTEKTKMTKTHSRNCCKLLLQPHRKGWTGRRHMNPFRKTADKREELNRCGGTEQHGILQHAASLVTHTLPSALEWKRMFGSQGRPQSPAHGGKEALTENEAVPLFRPHRTSHLGWGVREHSPHQYQNQKASTTEVKGRKGSVASGKYPVKVNVPSKNSAAL